MSIEYLLFFWKIIYMFLVIIIHTAKEVIHSFMRKVSMKGLVCLYREERNEQDSEMVKIGRKVKSGGP